MRRLLLELRCLTRQRREALALAVANRLPRWLVYWAAIRLMAHATTGRYGSTVVPDLRAMDALKRWERKETAHA